MHFILEKKFFTHILVKHPTGQPLQFSRCQVATKKRSIVMSFANTLHRHFSPNSCYSRDHRLNIDVTWKRLLKQVNASVMQ